MKKKNKPIIASSFSDEEKNIKNKRRSSSEESDEDERTKKIKLKQKKAKPAIISNSSSSADSSDQKKPVQKNKNEMISRTNIEDKLKELRTLLNLPNGNLLKKEQEIKNLIIFLGNNNCEISVNIIKKKPPPKNCTFCFDVIDENYVYGPLNCCPNNYVHKNCVIKECFSISPDLKESELNNRLNCQSCNKHLPFELLKIFLEEKIIEIQNRRKPCCYCEQPKLQNELKKKFCDHYYCKDCLKTLLATLVEAVEVNYDSIKCKFRGCDVLIFNENDFKTEFSQKYYKADDFYARITAIKKNEVLKRCVGSKDCPRFMTNSHKPQYICLNCENNLKEKKKEEEQI